MLGARQHGGALRRLRVDRGRARCAARITLGADDHVRAAVPPGAVGGRPRSSRRIGGMYEDNLYLSTLYDYLESRRIEPTRHGACAARIPTTACASRTSSFTYPGADRAGARSASRSSCEPRREPRAGRRERLGQDHADQAADAALHADLRSRAARRPRSARVGPERCCAERIGVIFQDFVRYQLHGRRERRRGRRARVRGRGALARGRRSAGKAAPFIETLPAGTRRSSASGSRTGASSRGGQWQKIALSRAFMRKRRRHPGARRADRRDGCARPRRRSSSTSAQLTSKRIAIVISHRFSTVRMADQIVVLDQGHIVERGSHEELMQLNGRYAQLFHAAGARLSLRGTATARLALIGEFCRSSCAACVRDNKGSLRATGLVVSGMSAASFLRRWRRSADGLHRWGQSSPGWPAPDWYLPTTACNWPSRPTGRSLFQHHSHRHRFATVVVSRPRVRWRRTVIPWPMPAAPATAQISTMSAWCARTSRASRTSRLTPSRRACFRHLADSQSARRCPVSGSPRRRRRLHRGLQYPERPLLYAINTESISAFSIDGSTGALHTLPGSPFRLLEFNIMGGRIGDRPELAASCM